MKLASVRSLDIGYRAPGEGGHPIGGSLMAQYLLAMLTHRAGREGLADPFSDLGLLGGPEDGRMGDYVFNQEGRQIEAINWAQTKALQLWTRSSLKSWSRGILPAQFRPQKML